MVTVERALLHALAFDFNVELPLPMAWRFLDAILGEKERCAFFQMHKHMLAPRFSSRCGYSRFRCSRWTLVSGSQNSSGHQTVPIYNQLFKDQASPPPPSPHHPCISVQRRHHHALCVDALRDVPCSFETTLCLQLRSCEIVYGCIKLAMATLKWASDVADQRVCEAVQKHFPGQQLQLTAATASLVQAAVVNILKANHPAAVAAAATPTVAAVFQPGGGSGEAGASSARHLPLVPGSVSNPAPSASVHWSAAAAAISCAASSGGAGDACSSGEHGASEASVCTHAPLPAPPCHREDWVEGAEYEVHGRSRAYIVTKYCLGCVDVIACSCSAWIESPVPKQLRTCLHLRRVLGDRAEILRIGHEYLARLSVASKIASLISTKRKLEGSPHDKENKKIKAESQAVNVGS